MTWAGPLPGDQHPPSYLWPLVQGYTCGSTRSNQTCSWDFLSAGVAERMGSQLGIWAVIFAITRKGLPGNGASAEGSRVKGWRG